MISLKNVHKSFGSGSSALKVLDGVDLEVGKGEFLAIFGRSGSGKSTLLNLVGGLDGIDSGSIVVDGQDLSTLNDRRLSAFRAATIGFVFQHFHLLPHLSALENVLLPVHFGPVAREPLARARELLVRLGLEDKISSFPPTLSGGQRQRVAIARALFASPRVILCDEPTGNLDVDTGVEILDLFESLAKEEMVTVLVVSHELEVARRADRILSMEQGQLRPMAEGKIGVEKRFD